MDIFPNETVLFQWLLFMTALVSLNYGVFRPVLHLIRRRREQTEGERRKAEELMKRSEHLLLQCEERLQAARNEGARLREASLREGTEVEKGLLKEARGEIGRKLDEMRIELERQTRTASLHLKQYGEEIGREIAERILERKI